MNLAGRLAPLSRLPRDARDTLFLLAVIACCIAPLAAHLPAWASAMTATLLAWRGWLAVGGRPLPGRWLTALLLALVHTNDSRRLSSNTRRAGITSASFAAISRRL